MGTNEFLFSQLEADQLDFDMSQDAANAAIRQNAHIANGGDAVFPCPACNGTKVWTGKFTDRHGRRVTRSCFKCQGKGTVSKSVEAAHRGNETRILNKVERAKAYRQANVELCAVIDKTAEWSEWHQQMQTAIDDYGSLTQNQVDAVWRSHAKEQARCEAMNTERAGKSGRVGVEAINALFQAAIDSGKKKPVFRAHGMHIAPARLHADRLYVKSVTTDTYWGKIENGVFFARRETPENTLGLLCEIANDPEGSAKKYGHDTGRCCFCHRNLTDDKSGKSVERGYGPICAERFGLVWG